MVRIDRRSLIASGCFGFGALAFGPRAFAAELLTATGFTHNVASGEPGQTSMLLWSRFVPPSRGDATVSVELSTSPDFTQIAAAGQMTTGPWRDHTVKIVVDGLRPGTRYHYRFIGPDGSISPIGRTRTLPQGRVPHFTIGIFSCSNLGFGYFNAYGHAVAAGQLDLAVHLGDYIYEYRRGGYDRTGFARVADIQPSHEAISLADYRLRYASYRLDPDLQALHQNVPMIIAPDDHEVANDIWEGGAENHQADEGDWSTRRAAALQAWHEWLPVGESGWQRYDIGTLASYIKTDGRMFQRSRAYHMGGIVHAGSDGAPVSAASREAALRQFRDGAWMDPAMSMLGSEQEIWLQQALTSSVRQGHKWQLLGSGTVMGRQIMPAQSADWLNAQTPAWVRDSSANNIAAARLGLPYNFDNWGGYPAARRRLLLGAERAGANLIVVAGDSHNGWAHELIEDGRRIGVEFGGQSVTSSGMEGATRGMDPEVVARAFAEASEELVWADVSHRGYMRLTLTPAQAINQWMFVDDVTVRSANATVGKTLAVRHGRPILHTL